MGVHLRERKNQDGTTSLYMDIYHEGRRYYEFLDHLKLVKPSNPLERTANKDKKDIAKEIATKKSLELQSREHNIIPKFKNKADFLEYYQKYIDRYPNKDKRVIQSSLFQFKEFLKANHIKTLPMNEVTEGLVEDFKNHLSDHMNGETPANYFKKFKKVLKQATKEKLLSINPGLDIRIKANQTTIEKEILTIDEISKLSQTPITSQQTANAFIFCCYTGLRWIDLISLKWENVDLVAQKLSFKQSKTKVKVNIDLHEMAAQMLPERPEAAKEIDFIFHLPSHTAALKNLRTWTKKAGIKKKITWHCSRHSFATNLLYYGTGALVVGKLIGHKSMNYIQRYTRVADEMKLKAINNLPSV